MSDNVLGDFLRARRSRLRPEDVGMASYGVRRVAGLRREEVAVLAGVNVDYCTRLEQGRERTPRPRSLTPSVVPSTSTPTPAPTSTGWPAPYRITARCSSGMWSARHCASSWTATPIPRPSSSTGH
ncbi:helix-turn-helix domain-containing protein [Streptomyces decoyicus]